MTADFLYSRCGIYCGACYLYRAERDRGDFLQYIAEWQKVDLDQIKCNGCFAPNEEKWLNCSKCWPWRCLKEKSLNYCYECEDFWKNLCEEYTGLEEFCMKRGENIRQNMINMMKDASKWLKEQEHKWRCSSCGEPYSWYEEYCHHCGNSLERSDLYI